MEANAIIDPVDDPNVNSIPFFGNVEKSLLKKKPIPLPRVRNQEKTKTCYGHVLQAVLYGDEVSRNGTSILVSRQEILDNIHKHKLPKSIGKTKETKPFEVPDKGFMCNYKTTFDYAKIRGVSPDVDYPWVGEPNAKTCDGLVGDKWNGEVIVGGEPIDPMKKIYISDHKKLSTHDEVKQYLEKQPVAGSIMLTQRLREWSGEEIYTGENAGKNVEKHAITLVGYGKEGDTHYYLCQNSYGLEWGYKGYFKAARDLISNFHVPVKTGIRSPIQRENPLVPQSSTR